MKPERVSEIYLESQPSNTITRFSFSFFFLLPFTKTKHYFSLQEACQTSAQNCMKIILEAKSALSTIRIRLLKRRRREVKEGSKAWWPMEGSKLGGHWKVPSLVAIGRFQTWWPLEGSKFGGHWKDLKLGGQWKDPKLGGQWKVPSLVAIGRIQSLVAYRNVKDKHLFTSSIFPQQLYLHPQFFPLTSRFYFTMVLSRYSHLSFLFFEL